MTAGLLLLHAALCGAQSAPAGASQEYARRMTLSAEEVGPSRFLAVHGQRSLVMGYPETGLEVWGYPFQILSGYQVSFRQAGAAVERDGRSLLRRIDYQPDSVTRTYIGPDFVVRETIFVPLDRAAAEIHYEVEGSRAVEIEIHFQPVLDLMWPAGLGGQYTRWNADEHGFVIAEPGRGFSAVIGSRQIVRHDDTTNSAVRPGTFGFTLQPAALGAQAGVAPAARQTRSAADVAIALFEPTGKEPASKTAMLAKPLSPASLADGYQEQRLSAIEHYAALDTSALVIETPDERINQALRWAVAAIDQAWVCNPMLGCGLVAGYGPSRDARRPQYAWFFAGDGLVGTNALISAGEFTRAKEELTFIQKYQEPKSGMIWHELSQSAGFIDWASYPYMYVHVDISFDYLVTLARYVAASGDAAFATERWPSIERAYSYCRSTISDADHLPHIPADKEAGDEQHRPADDLSLSASWMAAASAFGQLAKATGHFGQVEAAFHEAESTRASIAKSYWSARDAFWFDGHTQSGEPLFRHAVGPTDLLSEAVFSADQNTAILGQLRSADFTTDWGIRNVAQSAKEYDPDSYGAGSVSPLGSMAVAVSLWKAHLPVSAWSLWSPLPAWNTFDSPGHLHELFAGNFFHEETESVPEQTWSSAAVIDGTVRGLLGIEVDGIGNRLTFAPHLPANWPLLSLRNLRLPKSVLSVTLQQSIDSLDLRVSNHGEATAMAFQPQIPLGAVLTGSTCDGHTARATLDVHREDQHAVVPLVLQQGDTVCHLSWKGGISIVTEPLAPKVGDAPAAPKLVGIQLRQQVLALEVDARADLPSSITIRTPWILRSSGSGPPVRLVAHDTYTLDLPSAPASAAQAKAASDFTRRHLEVVVERR